MTEQWSEKQSRNQPFTFTHERGVLSSIEHIDGFGEMRRKVITMASLVAKVDVFTSDADDEFRIIRADGTVQGIFKTWAVPVIPFIENDTEADLAKHLGDGNADFWQRIGPELTRDIEQWSSRLEHNPTRLKQTLEKWRGFSELYDRRLYTLFQQRELPSERHERVAELYHRLSVAFGFASPFYHLEAMVGDGKDTPFNPLGQKSTDIEAGGGLDLVGMVLPSALRNKIVAEKLDWNGISWPSIEASSRNLDEEMKLAIRIARAADGVEPQEVIFAANVLEWIPLSVGGKKEDLEPQEARKLLSRNVSVTAELTHSAVGRDMNALIRFLNWFPLVRGEENFDPGLGWRYAAVCDTANQLLREVTSGGVFREPIDTEFLEVILPQLQHVDATSAKGRFLLQAMREDNVSGAFLEAIRDSEAGFIDDISSGLLALQRVERVVDVNQSLPRFLVGGKSVGLKEASWIFGKERIVGGVVITSELVESWLRSDASLWNHIMQLDSANDLEIKLTLSHAIRQKIDQMNFPAREVLDQSGAVLHGSLAVRSSSFDEDRLGNGSAAGIYESILDVTQSDLDVAARRVIASFFSDKAVSYRAFHGLMDLPHMAVIVSPYVQGRGGVAFTSDKNTRAEIVVGATPSAIVSGNGEDFDSYKIDRDGFRSRVNRAWLDEDKIREVNDILSLSEEVLGMGVDVEFVVDESGEVRILQLRSLEKLSEEDHPVQGFEYDSVVDISSLEDLSQLKLPEQKRIKMTLGENIDINQFQGDLFRWLVSHRGQVPIIELRKRIPRTSHFANVCINLGILLELPDD